jgi:hypothetical protein
MRNSEKILKRAGMIGALMVVMSLPVLSQTISMDTDFITWKISGVRNTVTGVSGVSNDMFKSSPDSIVWVSNNGKAIDKLHIDSKFETWPDVSTDGSVSFNVVWRSIPGTIAFQRNHGEARIITQFIKNNVNAAPYEFSVSNVVKD